MEAHPSPSSTPSNAAPLLPVLYPAWINDMEFKLAIGLIINGIAYGILLALGLVCLRVLHRLPHSKGLWNQRNMLVLHVSLLLLLNTAVEVGVSRENLVTIFKTRPEVMTYSYLGWPNIVGVVLFALTDGLLVWRCHMAQKVFLCGKSAGWRHIYWIIPLALWFAMICTAAITLIITKPMALFPQRIASRDNTLLVVVALCNALLNLFATTNIIIRLLNHRRAMIASFGRESSISNFPLKIVGILLESAVINIPTAIIVLVYAAIADSTGYMVLQINIPLQSCSSVLVIYQVAMRRAYASELEVSSRKEDVVSQA